MDLGHSSTEKMGRETGEEGEDHFRREALSIVFDLPFSELVVVVVKIAKRMAPD